MSDKEKKALFRSCASCGKKRLFVEDKHDNCIYCLYPDHKATDCKICRTFSNKTLRDREGRLLTWLQKMKTRKEVLSSDEEDSVSAASSQRSKKRGRSPPGSSTSEPPLKAPHKISDRSERAGPLQSPHESVKERQGQATAVVPALKDKKEVVILSPPSKKIKPSDKHSTGTSGSGPEKKQRPSTTRTPGTSTAVTLAKVPAVSVAPSTGSSTVVVSTTTTSSTFKVPSSSTMIASTSTTTSRPLSTAATTTKTTSTTSTTTASTSTTMIMTTSSSTRPSTVVPSTTRIVSTKAVVQSTVTVTDAPTTTASSTRPSTVQKLHFPVQRMKITPEMTSPRRVSSHLPTMLLDDESDEDEFQDNYGPAYSPSDLNVKLQETDTEEYFDQAGGQQLHPYVVEERHPPSLGQGMVAMPSSLISDLQDMLQDYRKRFPSDPSGQTTFFPLPPQPQVQPATSVPVVPSTPPPVTPLARVPTPDPVPLPDAHQDTSSDEEVVPVDPLMDPLQDPDPDQGDIDPQDPNAAGRDTSISPPVDIGGFHHLMERAAKRFGLPISREESECFLYDFKEQHQRSVKSIPIIEHVWEEGMKIMQSPATVIPVLPRLEKKYKAPEGSPACLIGQPKPDSVISQAAQSKSKNPSTPLTTPPDKDGRRLDNVGKRFSSMASLLVRAANALAILGRYDRQMWCDMEPFVDLLPEPTKEDAKKVLAEGEKSSAEVIDCAMDIASTAFRALAGSAVLRRQGWLKATWFRQEVQNRVLDLPFDGEMLFGKHVDDTLQNIKKDTDTAKSLGSLTYRKVPFRGARGRGFTSYRGNQQRFSSQSSQSYKPNYSNQRQGQSASFSRNPPRGRQQRQGRDNTKRQ
ncbi:uncharacterized protein LOC144784935 [Lissotriton helveticus]